MILPLAGRLDHLLHNMRRSRLIGISHPEIDNILTTLPRFKLQGLNLGEDIRWQPLDPIETFAQPHELPLTVCRKVTTGLIALSERGGREGPILIQGSGRVNLRHFLYASQNCLI